MAHIEEPENVYGTQPVPRPSGGFKRGVHEIVKLIGGILWLVGIPMLFLFPPLGVFIVFFAIILSILSVVWTRQRRHDDLVEIVEAASSRPADPTIAVDPTTAPRDAQTRLAELEELKASGAIAEAEYAQARKRILDGI